MSRSSLALALIAALSPVWALAQSPSGVNQEYAGKRHIVGVDTDGLDRVQMRRAARLLSQIECACGCGMSLLRCRRDDPSCPVSPGLAQGVVSAIRSGRSDGDIRRQVEPAEASVLSQTRHRLDATGAPARGPADAAVTITEFADFQCDLCALSQSWLDEIIASYPGHIRLVFHSFPIAQHSRAEIAAEAAAAAHTQGAFWKLHDKMFTHLRQVRPAAIDHWAGELGVDLTRFRRDLDSGAARRRVAADRALGEELGVIGIPTFFVNGRRLIERPNYETMRRAVEEELGTALAAPSAKAPAAGSRPAASRPAASRPAATAAER